MCRTCLHISYITALRAGVCGQCKVVSSCVVLYKARRRKFLGLMAKGGKAVEWEMTKIMKNSPREPGCFFLSSRRRQRRKSLNILILIITVVGNPRHPHFFLFYRIFIIS